MIFANVKIDISPGDRPFLLPICWFQTVVGPHSFSKVSNFFWHIVKTIDFSGFIQALFLCVVATNSVDVASESRVECSPKYFATTGNELVQHSVIVLIDGLNLVSKVIQEKKIVMVAKRIEESFVSLIRRDVDSAAIRYDESRVISINLFSGYMHKLVLKVTPAHVKAVIYVGIPKLDSLLADLLDDSSCGAIDFVNIPKVIADEPEKDVTQYASISSESENGKAPSQHQHVNEQTSWSINLVSNLRRIRMHRSAPIIESL